MNRRRFLLVAAGTTTTAVGMPWLAGAGAATDDELAYVNFGVAASLLASDFYARAITAKVFGDGASRSLRRGRISAGRHAAALTEALAGAGQSAPVAEDFTFVWPQGTFTSRGAAAQAGLSVQRTTLGAYQTAVASVSLATYRTLFAGLVAGLGQQVGVLASLADDALGAEPIPSPLDLEAASAALESYLG